MKNHLVKLTNNDSGRDTWGKPVYVSALAVQGIEVGDDLYKSDNDYKARHTSGKGEQPIGQGARVWFANDHVMVRESVEKCYALFEAKLKDLCAKEAKSRA